MKFERIGLPSMKKVTRHNPCPICGKPDWCFTSTSTYTFEEGPDEDFDFLGCRRTTLDQVAGEDGNYYVFTKESKKDGMSIYEEVHQRARRFKRMGIDENIKVSSDYQVKTSKKRISVSDNNLAAVEKRDEVYRYFLELLQLEDEHRKGLYHEGWDLDQIEGSMFKSVPPNGYTISQLIKKKKSGAELTEYEMSSLNRKNLTRKKISEKLYLKFGDLTGVPGFYLKHSNYNNENYWTFTGGQGMIMPMFDIHGKIYGLRVRVDNTEKNKYKWFSSFYEKLDSENETEQYFKNVYANGSTQPLQISYRFPDVQTNFLVVTEGEKKQWIVVDNKGLACANIPGVSSFSTIIKDIDKLKEMGIKFIIIAYDADKSENTHVLTAELKLIKALLEAGFEIYIAGWDEKLGKGIDDVLLSGNEIQYEPLLDYLNSIEVEEL
ncbi:MAG: DUF3854 domain-containing protein [Clostridiales bacterium]|nr:DUF3854 domain-containing protein [Clostridiales bacterium]